MERSAYQATFGKMISGIRVTGINGQRISFKKATLRFFAKIPSALPLGIGFVMIAHEKNNQALHDQTAKTLVENHRPSYFWRVFFTLLTLLVLGSFFITGFFVTSSDKSVREEQPLQEISPEIKMTPKNLSESQYDEFLAANSVTFDEGIFTNL